MAQKGLTVQVLAARRPGSPKSTEECFTAQGDLQVNLKKKPSSVSQIPPQAVVPSVSPTSSPNKQTNKLLS